MNHEVKLCQLGAPRNSIYPLHSLGILSTSFTKSELPASSHCSTWSWVDAHSPSVGFPLVIRPVTVPRDCSEILVAVRIGQPTASVEHAGKEFLTKEDENYKSRIQWTENIA